MPLSLVFNQIAVNATNENSTIATGQVNQPDWTWQGKNNNAAGITVGFFVSNNTFNTLIDNDINDANTANPELSNPQPNIQW
ncbi:hypothetical protein QRD89_05980 [Halobacillus sp. ACCC02827]|uniref:hypothetical protein n=1 Tax=unclassified Halobacillus TaxID=2636472 RepID=UPI0007815612|nr:MULTISPECIES: hypothetical protein [unclassified Halobacillus]WJE16893.1 hypothetical protein QRD89_05980 [Halobacillus sp. ACCC02827]